ncbi:MAG: hypothetical protein ACI9FN_000917 [Saprospiraceae bacterium]|jgi:hypothetical protein
MSTFDMGLMEESEGCCTAFQYDMGCCEEVESISYLDYDGLAYAGPQLDSALAPSQPLVALLPSMLMFFDVVEGADLNIYLPKSRPLLGIERRILFQSFLC